MLQKHFNTQEISMDNWPFWMLEENIKIVNEITNEENNSEAEREEHQTKSMPNIESMMKNMSNFKMPKI